MEDIKDSKDVTVHIFLLLSRGYSRQQVEDELIELGHEVHFIRELLQEAIKLRNSKKRVLGLSLILAGALLCLGSCIFTIAFHSSMNNYAFVLYGLTGIGIVLVFAGLTQVF